MSGEHVERRLAAILAADVAGSCRLIGIDEEGTLARLEGLEEPFASEHFKCRCQLLIAPM